MGNIDDGRYVGAGSRARDNWSWPGDPGHEWHGVHAQVLRCACCANVRAWLLRFATPHVVAAWRGGVEAALRPRTDRALTDFRAVTPALRIGVLGLVGPVT